MTPAAPPNAPPPIVQVLRAMLRSPTALQGGLRPLVADAAAAACALQEHCPQAFDEDGALRPDWPEAAQKALGGAAIPLPPPHAPVSAPVSAPPVIHLHLASRRIRTYPN